MRKYSCYIFYNLRYLGILVFICELVYNDMRNCFNEKFILVLFYFDFRVNLIRFVIVFFLCVCR